LSEKSSVLQFVSTFFNQIKGNLFENRPTKAIPNEVVCVSKVFASQDWMNWVKDENYRRELVLRGETFANVFLSYRRNFRESQQQPSGIFNSPNMIPIPTTEAISVPVLEHMSEPAAPEENTSFEIHNTDMTMV
jgi:hypothetical protein